MKKGHIYKILTTCVVSLLFTSALFAQGATEKDNTVLIKMEQYSASPSNASGPALDEMIAEFENKTQTSRLIYKQLVIMIILLNYKVKLLVETQQMFLN